MYKAKTDLTMNHYGVKTVVPAGTPVTITHVDIIGGYVEADIQGKPYRINEGWFRRNFSKEK